MYIYLGIIIILFAFCYGFTLQRKQTLKRLFRIVGYQLYYYVLGGRGILEDYVYFGRNKTCMYINTNNSFKNTVFWDMMLCSWRMGTIFSEEPLCGGRGAAVYSETFLTTDHTTRRHIPEDRKLDTTVRTRSCHII
jgi:hypothetical protein